MLSEILTDVRSEPKMGPKMTLWETRMGLLGDKFPQVSHSCAIGSCAKPKLAQIQCGSPVFEVFGDPATDAPVPPRAPPPYPLDTLGGLRTNFSSINPSDRASVIPFRRLSSRTLTCGFDFNCVVILICSQLFLGGVPGA